MSFAALENNNHTSNEVLFEITLDARAKFFLECLAEHSSVHTLDKTAASRKLKGGMKSAVVRLQVVPAV
jgi:hypothetical protein